MMKRIIILLSLLVLTLASAGCQLKLSGTGYVVSIQEDYERIFADCGSFLAYYDSCQRFFDSWPGSVCDQRYGSYLEVPESDRECYPVQDCDWFMKRPQTPARLAECRYPEDSTPRCMLSFDISCTDFSATQDGISLTLQNNRDYHIKDILLEIISEEGNIRCFDSQQDRILAKDESDVFTCPASLGEGIYRGMISLGFEDYRTNAYNTKTGEIVVEV